MALSCSCLSTNVVTNVVVVCLAVPLCKELFNAKNRSSGKCPKLHENNVYHANAPLAFVANIF